MTVCVESTYPSGVETATSLLVSKAPSGRYQRSLWAVARSSDFHDEIRQGCALLVESQVDSAIKLNHFAEEGCHAQGLR
jgi:hypothetical protein